jgi:hypothetical protein
MMLTPFLLASALALGDVAVKPDAALASMRTLASANSAHCALRTIGHSFGGKPIEMLVVSENIAAADSRPAILLVAGTDCDRPSSVGILVDVARRLIADPTLMRGCTFYVLPCANPDALLDTSPRAASSLSRNGRPVDDDRDRRVDEDPPRDVDGDGRILTMRRIAPPASDPPTHLPDPADPRLMRAPDAAKGLRATHTLYTEGLDTDLDGKVAEDATGGVDYDRNFPHRWREFDPMAGAYPISEPETRALAQFVVDHPRIVGAIVASRWDNLIAIPDAKPKDITGKTPMALHPDDQPMLEELAKVWKDASGQNRGQEADPSGSLALWLYVHQGIPTCATQLYGRPDPTPLPPPPPPPAPVEGAVPPPPPATPPPAPKAADEEAAQWLLVSDRDRGGSGFVPWRAFDHPTLGKVEIGGFAPGFRTDPPASEHERIAGAVTTLASSLAQRAPKVELTNITSRTLSPGVVEIECEVVNNGWLPTATAMGRANRVPLPVIVRLSVPKQVIEHGQRVTIVDGLEGNGGRRAFRWIVRAQPGERIAVEAQWVPQGMIRALVLDGVVQTTQEVLP